MSRFEGLTKRELLARAAEAGIRGRSRMRKAELIAALEALDEEPPSPSGDVPPTALPSARVRREALADRLRGFVDPTKRCRWRTVEGHVCGLPVIVGDVRCALHGGIDLHDAAVPVTGELGIHTWPTLARHLLLATYDIDPIGLDPLVTEMVWHVLNTLYFEYFRVEVEGIENVPMDGPALLVANHGGAALPYDGMMLALSVFNEARRPRRVRVVGTEIFGMLPFVSHLYRKAGGAYAARADAEYLLDRGALVGVFPEGERGFMKPIWQAYEVQRFGRGGFVDLAERTGSPIVPVAIVGSEEVHPAITVSERLAQLVRLFFPDQRVDAIAVFLNPIPLPVKWHIRFLPAVVSSHPGTRPDPLATLERTEAIRSTIQEALNDILGNRRTAF